MKKKVFWLAAMAVTVSMASCSLEEVVEQPAPQAIGFSSFVGKPTKAATEIATPGQINGLTTFYVYGAYGTDGTSYGIDVFNGNAVSVTNVNTPSTPGGEPKYWVANKKYRFVAYSNGNNTHTNVSFNGDDNGHITITDYEAGTSDLILAEKDVTTTDISGTAPGAVQLEFKHLLSQVAFEFKNGFTNGYQVEITGLQFNVPNKATYSYQGAYSWDTPDTEATKVYAVNGGAAFDNSAEKQSEYNFVIPQDNSLINASFTVTVYDTDGSTVVATKNYTSDKAVSLATGTTSNPAEGSNVWTPGYKYKYTATIDATILGDVLFPIQFTVTSVAGWDDAETTNDPDFGLGLNP